MTDADDRITEFFADISCELTPASVHQGVRVLFAPDSRESDMSRLCASILSDAERQKRGRLAVERDRIRFDLRRAFRRFCGAAALGFARPLSMIGFEETQNGRPFVPESLDLWFSFSSCRLGFLGAWSRTHAIGIDIEDQTWELEATGLARQYYSVAEAKAVEIASGQARLQTFYRYWCLKEAALKSVGEGLPYGLKAFEFELEPSLRVVQAPLDHGGPARFSAHAIEGINGSAALVLRDRAG